MDLDIVVIKTFHSTEEDFEAVSEHISSVDVLSFEEAGALKSDARKIEYEILKMQTSPCGLSRTLSKLPNKKFAGYNSALMRLIFEESIPIVLAERLSPIDSHNVNRLNRKSMIGISVKLGSSFAQYQGQLRDSVGYKMDERRIRHRGIARSVQKEISDRIRTLHPCLAGKDTVRYGILIGTYHTLETFLDSAPRVVGQLFEDYQDRHEPFELLVRNTSRGQGWESQHSLIARAYFESLVYCFFEVFRSNDSRQAVQLRKDIAPLRATSDEITRFSDELWGTHPQTRRNEKCVKLARFLHEHNVPQLLGKTFYS